MFYVRFSAANGARYLHESDTLSEAVDFARRTVQLSCYFRAEVFAMRPPVYRAEMWAVRSQPYKTHEYGPDPQLLGGYAHNLRGRPVPIMPN